MRLRSGESADTASILAPPWSLTVTEALRRRRCGRRRLPLRHPGTEQVVVKRVGGLDEKNLMETRLEQSE